MFMGVSKAQLKALNNNFVRERKDVQKILHTDTDMAIFDSKILCYRASKIIMAFLSKSMCRT